MKSLRLMPEREETLGTLALGTLGGKRSFEPVGPGHHFGPLRTSAGPCLDHFHAQIGRSATNGLQFSKNGYPLGVPGLITSGIFWGSRM